MKRQPKRLTGDAAHGFGGHAIDRARALTFSVDGHAINGFAGDTVLSALLANGILAAGRRAGIELGLDERFAPAIVSALHAAEPGFALPMARTPALDGAEFLTFGSRAAPFSGVKLPWRRPPYRSLDLILDSLGDRLEPWRGVAPGETITVDTLVIGGGVAGLSAAVAAARAGERVLLAEARPMLGGDAAYFGGTDRDEAPGAAIARLEREVLPLDGLVVMRRTEVLQLAAGRARAHTVRIGPSGAESQIIAVNYQRAVLATGMQERLPVFAGNRGPLVSGAIAAFHRAQSYGVQPGRRLVLTTTGNYTYRLALLAHDAGMAIVRIVDSRPAPVSRFVDFAKASGLTLAFGLRPEATGATHDGLSLRLSATGGETRQEATLEADALIAAGPLQPELRLWLQSGGGVQWESDRQCLVGAAGPDRVRLAGSAAGYRGLDACAQSGTAAIAALLGRPAPTIADPQLPAMYETAEGALTVAAPVEAKGAAYLDRGDTFASLPPPARRAGRLRQLPPESKAVRTSLGDLAARVATGVITPTDAPVAATVHSFPFTPISHAALPAVAAGPRRDLTSLPPFLRFRFGARPHFVVLAVADMRSFEAGCLIHETRGESEATLAVGVVLGPAPDGANGGGLAVLARLPTGPTLWVRDASGPVAARIARQVKASG